MHAETLMNARNCYCSSHDLSRYKVTFLNLMHYLFFMNRFADLVGKIPK